MIINLISSPRNISTALMYSFANRSDTKVIDEPFYGYYLHLTNADHPGKKEIIESQPTTVDTIRDWIKQTASEHPIVFVKNMAHHLINMDTDFLREYKSVFLIRDPKHLIPSFAKVIQNPQMKDIGIAHQFSLYTSISHETSCPIVDSGEILKDPKSVLTKLCANLEIDFEESMLSWPAKPLKEDGVWAKYWYNTVHKSGQFRPVKVHNEPLPHQCKGLYEESLSYYQQLSQHAIKA